MAIAYFARTADLGYAGTLSRTGSRDRVTWSREPLAQSGYIWDEVPGRIYIRLYPIGIENGMRGREARSPDGMVTAAHGWSSPEGRGIAIINVCPRSSVIGAPLACGYSAI